MYHRFRGLILIPSILELKPDDDSESYRTVTILRPMTAPSAATLKKNLFDWNKKGAVNGVPPIRIRWGDEQEAALKENAPPMPMNQQKPKLAPPVSEAASGFPANQSSQPQATYQSTEIPSSGFPSLAQNDAGRKGTIALPSPTPAVKNEVASNSAPSAIPNAAKPPSNIEAGAAVKVFENEQQAIRREGSGLFDTKGFPLGEYANLIIERVKGKWFIPSNLRNSQGHTTVVFFIDREGRYTDARIVLPSGNYSLDVAALNAIILSSPFPPLPKGFPGDHVGAKFVFSYNEPQ
jgi:TonB family protein